jgi:maleylacetate reductase
MSFQSEFGYTALPMRVRFGIDVLGQLRSHIAELGIERAIVVCTPEQRTVAESVLARLDDRGAGIFDRAEMHVPVEVADDAVRFALDRGADACVVVGGGSSVGLGKAIALQHRMPIIAIPTTYAGSEMTPVWGSTRDGHKQTGSSPSVLPALVLYDPGLTTTLPAELSAASGMNAMAHAVEALYAPDASPIISLMAEEGIRAFAEALPRVVTDPQNIDHRTRALYGAWLCGASLGATTMSLHHKLCHAIGGSLNLPHAQTHAIVLPYSMAYNESSAPAAQAAVRRALHTDTSAAVALWELTQSLPIPHALTQIGMTASDIDTVVEQALRNPYSNPREVTEEGLRGLLQDALAGRRPTVSDLRTESAR